eukprot:m51a1_g10289 hypothetical protein (318) ;mRNA; f:27029-28222
MASAVAAREDQEEEEEEVCVLYVDPVPVRLGRGRSIGELKQRVASVLHDVAGRPYAPFDLLLPRTEALAPYGLLPLMPSQTANDAELARLSLHNALEAIALSRGGSDECSFFPGIDEVGYLRRRSEAMFASVLRAVASVLDHLRYARGSSRGVLFAFITSLDPSSAEERLIASELVFLEERVPPLATDGLRQWAISRCLGTDSRTAQHKVARILRDYLLPDALCEDGPEPGRCLEQFHAGWELLEQLLAEPGSKASLGQHYRGLAAFMEGMEQLAAETWVAYEGPACLDPVVRPTSGWRDVRTKPGVYCSATKSNPA